MFQLHIRHIQKLTCSARTLATREGIHRGTRTYLMPEPTPDEKAASIINSVPSNSLWTKTGGLVLGTGLTAAAISSEIYVVNEETVLAVGFFIIVAAVAKTAGAPYTAWAEGHIEVGPVLFNMNLASLSSPPRHFARVRPQLTRSESSRSSTPPRPSTKRPSRTESPRSRRSRRSCP